MIPETIAKIYDAARVEVASTSIVMPPPEVTSRDNHPVPDKSAPMRVALAAADLGWDWALTYARGHVPHATTGRPTTVKAKGSIAVRLSRGTDWACAVYREGSTWTWDSMYVNGRKCSDITMFEERLTTTRSSGV